MQLYFRGQLAALALTSSLFTELRLVIDEQLLTFIDHSVRQFTIVN